MWSYLIQPLRWTVQVNSVSLSARKPAISSPITVALPRPADVRGTSWVHGRRLQVDDDWALEKRLGRWILSVTCFCPTDALTDPSSFMYIGGTKPGAARTQHVRMTRQTSSIVNCFGFTPHGWTKLWSRRPFFSAARTVWCLTSLWNVCFYIKSCSSAEPVFWESSGEGGWWLPTQGQTTIKASQLLLSTYEVFLESLWVWPGLWKHWCLALASPSFSPSCPFCSASLPGKRLSSGLPW